MKRLLLFFALLFSLSSCYNQVDPEVATKYITEGSREETRNNAVKELYDFYKSSSQDKEYYEVVSKRNGRFVLNYNRIDQRLTICGDLGSGWSEQFMNITESDLFDLVGLKVTLDELDGAFYAEDDVIVIDENAISFRGKILKSVPIAETIYPKTNGSSFLRIDM